MVATVRGGLYLLQLPPVIIIIIIFILLLFLSFFLLLLIIISILAFQVNLGVRSTQHNKKWGKNGLIGNYFNLLGYRSQELRNDDSNIPLKFWKSKIFNVSIKLSKSTRAHFKHLSHAEMHFFRTVVKTISKFWSQQWNNMNGFN